MTDTPQAMKRLLLIRHGMPDEGNSRRPHDPPLNETGLQQADELAKCVCQEGVDLIVSSPQLRAQNTATPLAALLGLPIETMDGLAEVDRNTDFYRSPQTIRREQPERWSMLRDSPALFFGLDEEAYRLGVIGAIAEVMKREATTIALFTHGTPIRTIVLHALSPWRGARFPLGHCSVSRLTGASIDSLQVQSVNESLVSQSTA
jgi:broad specificity phosphatase PhoE